MNAQFQRLVLRGIICEKLGVWDPIPFAEVIAIPSQQRPTAANAPSRRESRQMSRDEMEKTAGDQRVVRGRTDENGEMEASFGPAEGAWDVYVCIRAIRTPGGEKPTKELREEVCLFAGTYAFERGRLIVSITSKLYCLLKRRADAWTIAGRVTVCGTDKPAGGVTVTAMDTDWLQHDNLGSDVTNASGIFRIDYPGSRFRQGTWLDIELFGGPDVFFRIVDGDGNVLLNEPPATGRGPGRHDRSACFCVNLCVEIGGPGDGGEGGEPSPNAWVSVGSAFEIPTPGDLNDFDADGYAGAARFALYSTVPMRGYVGRLTGGGNPIEYRFRASTTTAPNGAPAVPEASFTRLVDGSGPTPLFTTTFLGHLVRTSPFKMVAVHATAADLKPGGWLNVNDVVQAAFAAEPDFAGLTLGTDVLWGRGTELVRLDTTGLTTEPDVPDGAANAGQGVPGANQIAIEKFAFRFDIREVLGDGTPVGPLPHNGTTLNAAIINNNPMFIKFDMAGAPACDPQTGSVELAYTVYHPHLRSVSLHVRANNPAIYNNVQTDVPPPANGILPITGNTDPTRTQVFNPSFTITPAITVQCAYLATLTAVPRLHTGESAHDGVTAPQLVFFWS
jgi:hypothetical protein